MPAIPPPTPTGAGGESSPADPLPQLSPTPASAPTSGADGERRGTSHRLRKLLIATLAGLMLVGAGGGITYVVVQRDRTSGRTTVGAPRAPKQTPSTTGPPPTTTPTTEPATTFASLYQNDASGVVRIDATTCSGSGVGSGFLISPTLVATAAHVVDGAVSIGVTDGDHTTLAKVIGVDDTTDVALLQVPAPLSGHVFTLAPAQPPVGTAIGVIGYPEGGPISFSQGSISGLDRDIEIDGQPRSGLIQTDAALNPGNSGGPLLVVGGAVVGLADALNTSAEGIGYAVPSTSATPLLASWQASPSPPAAPSCVNALGPSSPGQVQTTASVPAGIVTTLTTYFNAIDAGDYATAYAQLSPDQRANFSESQFASGDATSYDYDLAISAAAPTGTGSELVDVSFTSLQAAADGPNGDRCDNWTLEYTMIYSGAAWLIDGATGQGGVTHQTC